MSCKNHFQNLPVFVSAADSLPASSVNLALVCQDSRKLVPKLDWQPYQSRKQAGKMCYFCCSSHAALPIRDITNDFNSGYKMEPSYETGTYNVFKSCNQPSVAAATGQGVSHLFFITKYSGTEAAYQHKYFIVGLAEISATAEISGRTAIQSQKMAFTDIAHAYEITPERWQKICPTTKHPQLINLRYATQQIEGELFAEIEKTLQENNRLSEFIPEVERLNEQKYQLVREKEQEQFVWPTILNAA